jgi:hypothetical protein
MLTEQTEQSGTIQPTELRGGRGDSLTAPGDFQNQPHLDDLMSMITVADDAGENLDGLTIAGERMRPCVELF